MTIATQAEFARRLNVSPAHVTRLKQAGRLVMAGGLVEVEASIERIRQTEDPQRSAVKERWAQQRAANADGSAPTAPPDDGIGRSLQGARAVKEKFAALTAKIEYEKLTGSLVEKSAVAAAGRDLGATLRAAFEHLPDRLAPELEGMDEASRHLHIAQAIDDVLSAFARTLRETLQQAFHVEPAP